MRLTKLFTLIEQADPQKFYVIGDQHAASAGRNMQGAEILARQGATIGQIATQAQSVPDGSRVLVSAGAADTKQLSTMVGVQVSRILRGLKQRNCSPVFVVFPPVDLNGEFADVYRENSIDSNHNRVQAAVATEANRVLGRSNVVALRSADISAADPLALAATPQAYARAADAAKRSATAPAGEQNDVGVNNLQLDTSAVPEEAMAYLDADGDGIVTVEDAKSAGLPVETFSNYSGDAFGLFGILSNFMNQTKKIDPNSPGFKTWLQDAKANNPAPQRSRARGGATRNAQAALNYFKQAGYTDEQAAGIVGNLQAESGINLNPAAIGDGGEAWGIAQWHPARRAIWDRANNKRWQPDGSSPDFRAQLDFIIYELQRTESRANTRLKATNTVEDAAAVFDQYYERSNGQARQKRIELAQALIGNQQTADPGVDTNGNPLFAMDGASDMTQDDAAQEMQITLQQYRRMMGMLDFRVRINDAIAKDGTSRERKTPGSQHFHGTALDLSIAGLSQDQVKRLMVAAKQVGFTGFGFGKTILHVDRGPSRTWDYGNNEFAGMNLQAVKNWATA